MIITNDVFFTNDVSIEDIDIIINYSTQERRHLQHLKYQTLKTITTFNILNKH